MKIIAQKQMNVFKLVNLLLLLNLNVLLDSKVGTALRDYCKDHCTKAKCRVFKVDVKVGDDSEDHSLYIIKLHHIL